MRELSGGSGFHLKPKAKRGGGEGWLRGGGERISGIKNSTCPGRSFCDEAAERSSVQQRDRSEEVGSRSVTGSREKEVGREREDCIRSRKGLCIFF